MSILDALQSAALRLYGSKPTVFFGAPNQFEMELCDWANEVAQDIAKYRDWQALQVVQTLTGDGVATSFDLPADFDRMNIAGEIQNLPGWMWGYYRFNTMDDFLFAQARDFDPFPGGWIISGNKLQFAPEPPSGQSATYTYVSSSLVKDANGGRKAKFSADTDTFMLPERLLTLGIVWRWRENKKLDSTGDQEAFVKALDEVAAKDGGSKVLRYSGANGSFRNTYPAWPGILGNGPLQWGNVQW